MRVSTTRFGEIEVPEEELFEFPMGLLGFSRNKLFCIIDHRDESPFKWLQCVEDGELAFIISDPAFFKPDYRLSVRPAELSIIAPFEEADLVLSVIMTVPPDPRQMSANLLAPVIFNVASRKGMQYVLTSSQYPVKFFVVDAWEQRPTLPHEDTVGHVRPISLR